LGEVKIYLNCDAALRQPNFHIPNLDDVIKSVERNTRGLPSLLILNYLDEAIRMFMHKLFGDGSMQALSEDRNESFRYVNDITKGS
jgi:hypothetical protein